MKHSPIAKDPKTMPRTIYSVFTWDDGQWNSVEQNAAMTLDEAIDCLLSPYMATPDFKVFRTDISEATGEPESVSDCTKEAKASLLEHFTDQTNNLTDLRDYVDTYGLDFDERDFG